MSNEHPSSSELDRKEEPRVKKRKMNVGGDMSNTEDSLSSLEYSSLSDDDLELDSDFTSENEETEFEDENVDANIIDTQEYIEVKTESFPTDEEVYAEPFMTPIEVKIEEIETPSENINFHGTNEEGLIRTLKGRISTKIGSRSSQKTYHPATTNEEVGIWMKEPLPGRKEIPFIAVPGIKEFPEELTPFGFFKLLFTRQLMEYLVVETNAYAQEVLVSSADLKASSRILQWRDTTVDELYTFFGILFYMGLVRIHRIRDYWSTNHLFGLPISKYMARDRYLLLLRCLHFTRNVQHENPLGKIMPILEYFNDTMEKIYYPDRNLSINESMSPWRGKLNFRERAQGKRHNYRMKLFALVESSGMIQSLHIHDGHDGPKVVNDLIQKNIGVGHSLFIDNYYSSVPLAIQLLEKGCYITGTLKASSKANPKDVVDADLRSGEVVSAFNEKGVCVCKWNDKENILTISSEFGAELVDVRTRSGKIVKKPRMIAEYDKYIKGIDLQNKTLLYYPTAIKFLQWYKRLSIHIFHVMLVNAYFLYNRAENTVKKDLYNFHLEIVSNLLPKKVTEPILKPFLVHLPTLFPKSNNRRLRKRCKVCMKKTGKRVESTYGCTDCPGNPGLCLKPCFREYHNYQ